ncbi:single-stranded DNA-binding protein [Eggerthellaceae bacterium 24-137]
MSINRVIISGNLTRDPELRCTQSGMDVLSFGVAVNDRRKNSQTGEWEDHPNFVDCTMFGNRARSVAQYLSKGAKVSIEGKLRWEQWERDGQKRSTLKVVVDELEFMSSRQGAQGGPYGASQQQVHTYQAPAPNAAQAQPYAPQQPACGAQQPLYGYQPQQYAPAAPGQAAAKPAIDASSSVYDDDIPF